MTGAVEFLGTSPNGVGAGPAWAGEASFVMPEPWAKEALCAQTDPELFFPERGGDPQRVRDAKAVCAKCEVAAQCLEYALRNDERTGIWGGLTRLQRARLRNGRAA